MNDPFKIKSQLEEIQARPTKMPSQMTLHEVTTLMGERELLLKISIQLEKQNLFLMEKLKMDEPDWDEKIIRPVKKDKEAV